MINQDQFKEVKERVDAIESYLKIPEKRMELSEQELKTQDPDFWNDPKAAEVQMKKIRGIKVWIQSFDELTELLGDLEVLIEFAKEGEATEEEVQQKYNVDIYRHFKELQKIREQALENGSYSAAVQAEVARGKAAGLYVEQKIIKHGKLDQLTEEELDEKIGELMREMKIVDGELIDDAKKIN